MVEDGRGNVLLQKRAPTMELFPGRWEASAAGHVDEGFDYETTALQEAAEELGMQDVQLEVMGKLLHRATYERHIMNHFA